MFNTEQIPPFTVRMLVQFNLVDEKEIQIKLQIRRCMYFGLCEPSM